MSNIEPSHPADSSSEPASIPHQSLLHLFLRFLRFGCLAWGGPVAQIGMLRHELVDEERWISSHQFNRVLAVYQALPGPEAHELCVYFGMRARGRIGGLLAGLGFMLPGLLLVLALAWIYMRFGVQSESIAPVLAAMQVAVAALIVRAVFRIGRHALVRRGFVVLAIVVGLLALVWQLRSPAVTALGPSTLSTPSYLQIAAAGLKTGLLTFGGAYTAIPVLQQDAVLSAQAWMTPAQFIDSVALSGLLPAPLIIFSTFVGYVGRGLAGALLITMTTFAPAFGFTLLGHEHFERLVRAPRMRSLLDCFMAAVVGLIAATAIGVMLASVTNVKSIVLFTVELAILFVINSRWIIPAVIVLAAASGWAFF